MITLAARALNSICIQRILGVLEERAKQQRNLPMMISLGDLGKRAGRAENVAPMLKKVRLTVERSVYRQQASNRQHGSRLFASIHRVMPVSKRTCHFESESLISIAHFRKIMIAVCGSSKRTTSCGKPPRVFNTDQHYRPACAVFIWLRSRPRPLAVVEHSKTQRPQHSPPPALGPLSWCGLKKISARKGLVFPMERSLGGNKRAQSSDVAGGLSVQKQLS